MNDIFWMHVYNEYFYEMILYRQLYSIKKYIIMLFCQLDLFLFKDDLSPNKYAILSIIKNKKKQVPKDAYLPPKS